MKPSCRSSTSFLVTIGLVVQLFASTACAFGCALDAALGDALGVRVGCGRGGCAEAAAAPPGAARSARSSCCREDRAPAADPERQPSDSSRCACGCPLYTSGDAVPVSTGNLALSPIPLLASSLHSELGIAVVLVAPPAVSRRGPLERDPDPPAAIFDSDRSGRAPPRSSSL